VDLTLGHADPSRKDFDGTSTGDFLWRNDNGTVATWDISDHTILSGFSFGTVGNDWHVAGVGDFNGDGKSDIAWRNDNGAVATWDVSDHTILSGFSFVTVGNDWHLTA
jgi:hypothetical protein